MLRLTLVVALAAACGGSPPPSVEPGTDSHAWFDDAELQHALDETSTSTTLPGNSVELLINGVESFARRYANLKTARFVLVKTFIWTDDDAGRKLAAAIARKARAGVPVIIQYDVKGNIGSVDDAEDMLSRANPERPVGEPRVIADLRAAGATIVAANSPGRPYALKEWVDNTRRFFRDPAAALRRSRESLLLFNHVDHDKYFVTVHDGGEVRAIVGGLNIASEYALGGVPGKVDSKSGRGGWRDTDLEIRGPAAHAIIDEFVRDMKRHLGKSPPAKLIAGLRRLAGDPTRAAGRVAVRLVFNNPLFEKKRRIDNVYRLLVQATPRREPIFMSTPYFAPSKRLRQAMIEHMKGGGTITVLTNSYDTNDTDILTDAARYSARELMKAAGERFRLLERIRRPDLGENMLHQKVASFGRYGPVVVGSANLDAQSFVHNGEVLAVIDDPAFRRRFDEMVAADTAADRARLVDRATLETAPVLERMRSFAAHELAWYWL